MHEWRVCLVAVALTACGDSSAPVSANESVPDTNPQMDAMPVEIVTTEGGAGAGGSVPTIATEAGMKDAMAGKTDASDAAIMPSGPDRWTGSPHVMDTWFWTSSTPVADRVTLVQQLGYQGLALSVDHQVAEYVTALRAKGLKMPGIWLSIDVTGYPTDLVKSITGTDGWIWLSLASNGRAASDPAGDDVALVLIKKLADEAHAAGLPGIALYPHVGNWMDRVGDAVRIAKKAARPDVGVVFNQYHWMVVEGGRDLAATLANALPYLKDVNINGSDASPSILPLGQGAYDTAAILRALSALDFHGTVGLQGYSIGGDIPGKLQSAKQAWDSMVRALPRDGG
jgi:sugar phosphate isomerase/epimerase